MDVATRAKGAPTLPSIFGDAVAVVHIKPFTQPQKAWRPLESLYTFFDHRSPSSLSGPAKRTEPTDVYPPRAADESVVCPRLNGVAGERTPCHPRAKEVRGAANQPLAFVTKPGREKSTVQDIRAGNRDGASGAHSSCVRRTVSDPVTSDTHRSPAVRTQGRHLVKTGPTAFWQHLPPHLSREHTIPPPPPPPPQPNRTHDYGGLCDSDPVELQRYYISCSVYDTFDRSNTLSSFRVKPAAMKISQPRVARTNRLRDKSARPAFQLGVANALDVFSNCGTPLRIERQISRQLRVTMQQLRRSMSMNLAFNAAPATARALSVDDDPGRVMKPLMTSSDAVPLSVPLSTRAALPGATSQRDGDVYPPQAPPVYAHAVALLQDLVPNLAVRATSKPYANLDDRCPTDGRDVAGKETVEEGERATTSDTEASGDGTEGVVGGTWSSPSRDSP